MCGHLLFQFTNNIEIKKLLHKHIIKYIDDAFVKENGKINIKLKVLLDVE